MTIPLFPCDMKNGNPICSYDPRLVIECRCPSCIAARILFLNPRDVFGQNVGMDLIAQFDEMRRSVSQ